MEEGEKGYWKTADEEKWDCEKEKGREFSKFLGLDKDEE